MKMFRKLVSLVAAATLLTSSLAFTFPASAAASPAEEAVAADTAIQANVQDGLILHAFNWSYNSIKENLPAIAAAGYSTVQTSPVQQPKDFSASRDVGGQWWKLYQPVSFSIAQKSWLGTKSELTSLCAEADKYGIKIICDIVSNHFGNKIEKDPNSLSDDAKTYSPTIYNNKSTYFRSNSINADSDSDLEKIVHGHVSACPDLKTETTEVQNAVIGLLKECIDCGVDGFRFDAAKHIESPGSGSNYSNYWPNVTSAAKSYYTQKTGKNLYIYGEILNTPGGGRSWSAYTQYINTTDNKFGNDIRSAFNSSSPNMGTIARSSYNAGSGSQVVLWAESHDTYEENSSSGVSNENIVKTWAMVGSRKDATALFFARPGTALMGDASTDATYKSTAVSEINKFHNKFVGQSEKVGSSGNIAYVQRGGKGIVLANAKGMSTSVSVSGTGMANGTYTDMISGNKFTVSGGTVTGQIGSTGVAVVYEGTPTPRATASVESGSFKGETLTVKLTLENAVKGTYCLDDSTPVTFTNGTTIKIGSDYKYNETINLTLEATGANGDAETTPYHYLKLEDTSSNIYIWFDAKAKSSWKTPLNCYMYDEDTAGDGKKTVYTNAAAWPGETMTYDAGQDMWYYKVPTTSYLNGEMNSFDLTKSQNAYFIVSGSGNQQQFPAEGGHSPKLAAKSWEFVKGSSNFKASTRVPTPVVIPATEVTKGKAEQPTTAAPTTAAPTTLAPTTAAPTTVPPTTVPPTVAPAAKTGVYKANTMVPIYPTASTSGNTVGTVFQNREVKVTETQVVDGHTWGKTTYNGNTGWIDLGYTTYVGELPAETTAPVTTKPVPTTAAPTTKPAPTTVPVVTSAPQPTTVPGPAGTYYYGDVNGDGIVDVRDASMIQLHAAAKTKLSGIPLILADVNGDGEVDVRDASMIQLYSVGKKASAGKCGQEYKVEVPTTKPVPTTKAVNPTTEPAPSGKSLKVVAGSNIFPQASTTFDPVANQITVTYWMDVTTDVMINTQWTMTYDNKVLSVDMTDGVNRKLNTRTGQYTEYAMRATNGVSTVINYDPDSLPNGGIKGNASSLSGYELSKEDGSRQAFVSVTFNPTEDAEGVTYVYLDVEIMQLGNATNPQYFFVNNSEIVDDSVKYLPDDTAVAVYAGPFDDTKQQKPDEDQPKPQNKLTVVAGSNIFPQATTTFNPVSNQITVTYWMDITTDIMINTQWTMTYDNKVLAVDMTDGVNRKLNTRTGQYTEYIIRATDGVSTVINYNPESIPGGGIKGNATSLAGFELSKEDGSRQAFVSVTFNPVEGAKGVTNVYLDVEIMQLANATKPQYYFINDSRILEPGVKYLPDDTAVAVYAGPFDDTKQQKPDEVQPTTAPETVPVETTTEYVEPTTVYVEPTTVYVEPTTVYVEPTTAEPWTEPVPDGQLVKFTDNQGWGTVYVHVWNDAGDITTWPGIPMENIGDNGYGSDNFQATIPGGATGMCFTAGADGPQTGNVTDFNHEGWYTDPSRTEINDLTGATVFTPIPWDEVITPGEGKLVKFTDNQGWGTVYVHAWNDAGDLDTWPGTAMTNIGDNGYGSQNFEATIPDGATGMCFTAGADGPQTGDVTDFNHEGWYTDASRTEINALTGATVLTPIPWDETITPGGGKLVKFTDNAGWGTVYVHAWNDAGDLDTWPGTAMTNIGDNGYGSQNFEATIPDGATGCCFTKGADGPQTGDVTDFSAEGWFTDPSRTEVNGLTGATVLTPLPWGTQIDDPGDNPYNPPTPGDGKVVKFTDNAGWGTVYVHAWNDAGDLDTWPGTAMTNTGDNGYGKNNFEATIPAGATGICFTAGADGPQTGNVTDFSAEGWFTDPSRTEVNDFTGATVLTPLPWGTVIDDPGDNPGDDPYNPPTPGDGQVVKFTDNAGWGTVYVHAWNDAGDLDTWPGIAMTNTGDNGYGKNNFEATIPAGATGICFTAGADGPQTGNVTDLSAEGWFTDPSRTEVNDFTGATVLTPLPWGTVIDDPGDNPGDDPYNPPTPGDGQVVKFTDNAGWGTVYVHAWNDAGDLDTWPGIAMTNTGDNGYGKNNFEATIPAGATGICFTAGADGPQTGNVTDLSAEGWFTDPSRTETNDFGATVLTPLPWGTVIDDPGDNPGGENPPVSDTYTIYFTDNQNWGNVYVHYWGDGIGTQWPGVQMSRSGDDGYGHSQFSAQIPSAATGLVFNNNNGQQTVDVATAYGTNGWWTDGSMEGGKFKVIGFSK